MRNSIHLILPNALTYSFLVKIDFMPSGKYNAPNVRTRNIYNTQSNKHVGRFSHGLTAEGLISCYFWKRLSHNETPCYKIFLFHRLEFKICAEKRYRVGTHRSIRIWKDLKIECEQMSPAKSLRQLGCLRREHKRVIHRWHFILSRPLPVPLTQNKQKYRISFSKLGRQTKGRYDIFSLLVFFFSSNFFSSCGVLVWDSISILRQQRIKKCAPVSCPCAGGLPIILHKWRIGFRNVRVWRGRSRGM